MNLDARIFVPVLSFAFLSLTTAIGAVPTKSATGAKESGATQVDYSGLGLNTKQVAALHRTDLRQEAEERASFDKLWADAPAGMKAVDLPKSVWFGLYKWSISMGTIGMCSKFLNASDAQGVRHAWDAAKGKGPYLDAIVEAGDDAFQDGDARGNDPDAPDQLTCAVALRSLEASDAKAVAEVNADLDAAALSKGPYLSRTTKRGQ